MKLDELPTPCLLLDASRMERNVARLKAHLQTLGFSLRPHLKTSKCVELARLLMQTPAGPAAVSTLEEAEQFGAAGVRDILYAVGIAPQKLPRVIALRNAGIDLSIILDSREQAQVVIAACCEAKQRIPVLIEVDSDGHRAGVLPDDPALVDIGRILHLGGADLRGVMTHAGGSYDRFGADAHAAAAEQERAAAVRSATVLREAELPCPVVSVGSTPTAHFARDLSGVTEVRAGVFVFLDLVMAGLGVCTIDDIALTVLATVIGLQREKGWIIVDAGWMASLFGVVAAVRRATSVLLLDHQVVSELLTLGDCIPAVEAAFAAHARGAALSPGLLHVSSDGGDFHIKAGGLRDDGAYFCAKINGSFFNNRSQLGLPNVIGLILLCDGANGTPLAVMESGIITRLRTGAATAVAARYLARPQSSTVTICGAGVQAEVQLRALKEVLPVNRALIWSRSGAEAFAANMRSALGIDVDAVTDLKAATRLADVIVTCTPATRWFLGREHVRPGTFIAAVGADGPGKQELEAELIARNAVVPDLLNQAVQVGELQHAVAGGLIRGELGAVIAGLAPGRIRDDEVIIFDSTGTALQDAAAAVAIYKKAVALGRGEAFGFWG